jgi:hypothetical protein
MKKLNIEVLRRGQSIKSKEIFSIDLDYVENLDDIICHVEHELYSKYKEAFYFNVDFDIINEIELCEEIFNRDIQKGYNDARNS